MTHTGPNLTHAMRREWNRKLVERRARRAIAAIRSSAPQPSLLRLVTTDGPDAA